MARKNTNAPRSIYTRNGITHLLFDGKVYGSTSSELDTDVLVNVTKLPSNGGRARVQVAACEGTTSEVWHTVRVPVKHRG